MPRVTYEAERGEVETIDCDYAGSDEDGVFCVCLDEVDGDEYRTRIPMNRVVRINESV